MLTSLFQRSRTFWTIFDFSVSFTVRIDLGTISLTVLKHQKKSSPFSPKKLVRGESRSSKIVPFRRVEVLTKQPLSKVFAFGALESFYMESVPPILRGRLGISKEKEKPHVSLSQVWISKSPIFIGVLPQVLSLYSSIAAMMNWMRGFTSAPFFCSLDCKFLYS